MVKLDRISGLRSKEGKFLDSGFNKGCEHKRPGIVKFSCLTSFFLLIFSLNAISQNGLKTYAAPAAITQSKNFTVMVRNPGQKWLELSQYKVKVDRVSGGDHVQEEASMASFDFSGEVEVSVTSNAGTINNARIRPLSYNIEHQIEGSKIMFKLNKPANISVEVNGDIFHNLHLFANPIETFIPNKKDKNVMYFPPGLHEIPGGKLSVLSGTSVYLAGGSVLKGQILLDGVENVKVIGRGIIDQSIKGAIKIANSKNIEIEGVFATQCFTGGSENVTIRNVKCISYYKWGDGMNVISSNNVLMDGVFNRNSDDCTTVYGTRGAFTGGCKNITMQNSTLWADVAHPILIGTHGNSSSPDVLQNLKYINIDILDHNERQVDYQGCLSINAGDSNFIKDVLFQDIRIEDFREGQLFNLRVFYNSKYCTSPGKGIENVLFKNISYKGKDLRPSIILGYDEQRKVRNVTFENLKINGTLVSDDMRGKPGWFKTSDMANMFVGDHVEDIKFIK